MQQSPRKSIFCLAFALWVLVTIAVATPARAFEGVWQFRSDTLRLHRIGSYVIGDTGSNSVLLGLANDTCLVGHLIGPNAHSPIALRKVDGRLVGYADPPRGRLEINAQRLGDATSFNNFRQDGLTSQTLSNQRNVFDGRYTSPFGTVTLFSRDLFLIGDYGARGFLAGLWDGDSYQGYFLNDAGDTGWFDFAFLSRSGAFRSGSWGMADGRGGNWQLTLAEEPAGMPRNAMLGVSCPTLTNAPEPEPAPEPSPTPAPEPEPEPAAADFSTPNGLDLTYRDIGVLIHHTRIPFRTSPARFAANVAADRNWTGAEITAQFTRMVASNGQLIGAQNLPPDVVMSIVTPVGATGSTCVISYRGTDREHLAHPELEGDIKEGLIATSVLSGTMTGTGPSCVVKNAYLRNYEETRSQIMSFLDLATGSGECMRGILIAGMSLGGATANLAFTDLTLTKRSTVGPQVAQLVASGKVWMTTVGAPRSVSEGCAAAVQSVAGDRAERFIYGSEINEISPSPRNCALFNDPVPGNPYVVASQVMGHFGQAIVGYNTIPSGNNPSTPDLNRVNTIRCMSRGDCLSKRFANRHARVASRTASFTFPDSRAYPRIGADGGGQCSALGLIPNREWMFGRLHDTCSYRNLLATYGQKHNGEPDQKNYVCPLPPSVGDPQNYPNDICPLGVQFGDRGLCSSQPIGVRQLQLP